MQWDGYRLCSIFFLPAALVILHLKSNKMESNEEAPPAQETKGFLGKMIELLIPLIESVKNLRMMKRQQKKGQLILKSSLQSNFQ